MKVGKVIYKLLSDNTAVAGLVGTRIAPSVMEQSSQFPFIIYDIVNDSPDRQKSTTSQLNTYKVLVSAYSQTYTEASFLGNYIRTALDRRSGNFNGVEIQSIDFEGVDDVFDDMSGKDGIFRKSLDFKVRVVNSINNIYSTIFDGVDDLVSLGVTGMSSIKNTGSISAWFKLETIAASGNIFQTRVDSNNSIFLYYNAGTNELIANYKAGGNANNATANDSIEGDGLWHHVASTWDSSGNVKLYLDGNLKATTAISGTFTGSFTTASIGSNSVGGGFWKGNIDEVSVFNAELSSSQVTSLYNGGYPDAVAGLANIQFYYKMGDGDNEGNPIATAPTIIDEIGNNNGTMVNMEQADFVADVPKGI
tara:strand:+ start:4704 stop:5795 length:1092 start_codon:yes stop_codon:yes gene_type:complete